MKTALFWIACVAASGTAGAFGYFLTGYQRNSGPVLDAPEQLDLGDQETGTQVVTPVQIFNRGRSELRLTQTGVSCGCLSVGFRGLEPDEGGVVRIPPFGAAELEVGFTVTSPPRSVAAEAVSFRTNDPNRPEMVIRFRAAVFGAILADPPALSFPNLKLGESREVTVCLQDGGRKQSLRVGAVKSTIPDIVKVERVLPTVGGGEGARPTAYEVTLSVRGPDSPTSFSGYLGVRDADGTEIHRIPLSGESIPPIRITPDALVFPRATGDGLTYSGRVLCSSTQDQPFTLTLVQPVAGLNVVTESVGTGTHKAIAIRSDLQPQPKSGKYTLLFRATGKGVDERIALSVRFWSPP